MKKTSALVVVCLIFLLPSCYEDGPWISFRTKEKRICGHWVSAKVIVNDALLESEGGGRSIEFTPDGGYSDIKGDSLSGFLENHGTWAFSEDKKFITLTVVDEFSHFSYALNWEILKLSFKEIRLRNDLNGTRTDWWLTREDS